MQKVKPLVVVIQILVGLEYAAIFGMSFLNPINAYGIGTTYREYSFAALSLAILGMSGLSYALRNIKHREEVWLSLLIAVGLAPFVTILFAGIVFNCLKLTGVAVTIKPYVAINILGFFLSFAFIGFRMRRKYPHDQVGKA